MVSKSGFDPKLTLVEVDDVGPPAF